MVRIKAKLALGYRDRCAFLSRCEKHLLVIRSKMITSHVSGGESSHNVREGKGNVSKVVVKHFQKDHTNVE